MKIDLSGKQALVTGSTAGIGLAIATGLAQAGTGVIVNTILPGPTRTKGALQMMAGMAAERGASVEQVETLFLKENRPSTLLRRFSTPEEVAQSERVCGVAPG